MIEDRFFAEILDARERAVTEACWAVCKTPSPQQLSDLFGDREARMQVEQLLNDRVRPFLAMFDAALKAVRA